jgi:GT2 family glycosyltransferase
MPAETASTTGPYAPAPASAAAPRAATPAGPAPDVSVVFVNWNSLELTTEAIRSLKEHTRGCTYEIIVVDNASSKDDSARELPRRFPDITLIANPDNRGFAAANNQAYRVARGRHVLLLNTDTVQIEDAVSAAVRRLDALPDVGALGILHLNNDAGRTPQPSFHRFCRPWREVAALLGLPVGQDPPADWSAPPPEQDVDWVCASFFLLRRAACEAVGLLDERYFIYDEDPDWCLRARESGWKVRFWPGARMIHLGAASSPLVRDKNFAMYRSHLTYLRKNHSFLAAAAFYAAMGLRLAAGAASRLAAAMVGRAALSDVRVRIGRLRDFLLLRPGRTGI